MTNPYAVPLAGLDATRVSADQQVAGEAEPLIGSSPAFGPLRVADRSGGHDADSD